MSTTLNDHLYVHDLEHLSVHESFVVFDQMRIENYLHGRCHLMALALAEGAGLQCGVMLDLEAGYNEDGEPSMALEHAFCVMGNGLDDIFFDARGGRHRNEISSEYNQAFAPELIFGSEAEDLIRSWIANGLLEDYVPGEREALARYVQELQKYPCLQLLPEDSKWHEHKPVCFEQNQPFTRGTNGLNGWNFDPN